MKKILFWVTIGAIIAFSLLAEHPMLTLFNFIIGGVVPGLNISLGFLPFLSLIILFAWLLKKWISAIRLDMLKRTADINKIESVKKEFSELHGSEQKKNHSVIAAPNTKTHEA